jgi:hypothetical protein
MDRTSRQVTAARAPVAPASFREASYEISIVVNRRLHTQNAEAGWSHSLVRSHFNSGHQMPGSACPFGGQFQTCPTFHSLQEAASHKESPQEVPRSPRDCEQRRHIP